MIIIKRYTEDYKDAMIPLVAQFYKEAFICQKLMPFDSTVVDALCHQLSQHAFIAIDSEAGKLVGVIAGQVISHPMTKDKLYQEVIWYVAEGYRSVGVKMLRFLEAWCKTEGITRLIMACIKSSKFEKLCRFYEAAGFEQMEVHYMKEL